MDLLLGRSVEDSILELPHDQNAITMLLGCGKTFFLLRN
jgi:hypothetical protein